MTSVRLPDRLSADALRELADLCTTALVDADLPDADLANLTTATHVLRSVAIAVLEAEERRSNRWDVFRPNHARLATLLAERGHATDGQLFRWWLVRSSRPSATAWPSISESGLRTRRAELVRWGIVTASDLPPVTTPAGGRSARWQLASPEAITTARHTLPVPTEPASIDAALAVFGTLNVEAGIDVVAIAHLELLRATVAAALSARVRP